MRALTELNSSFLFFLFWSRVGYAEVVLIEKQKHPKFSFSPHDARLLVLAEANVCGFSENFRFFSASQLLLLRVLLFFPAGSTSRFAARQSSDPGVQSKFALSFKAFCVQFGTINKSRPTVDRKICASPESPESRRCFDQC
jgi:hypothetical protein